MMDIEAWDYEQMEWAKRPQKKDDESWEDYCMRLSAFILIQDGELQRYRRTIPAIIKLKDGINNLLSTYEKKPWE